MAPERGPEIQGVPVTGSNWHDPPFNLWAYWHVVRQHYGFLVLYQRKAGVQAGARADLQLYAAGSWPEVLRLQDPRCLAAANSGREFRSRARHAISTLPARPWGRGCRR